MMDIHNNKNEYNFRSVVKEVMNDLSDKNNEWRKSILPIKLLLLLGSINEHSELEGLVRIKTNDINTLEIIVKNNGINFTYYYSTITPVQFDNIKKIVDDAIISLTTNKIISKINQLLNSLNHDELEAFKGIDAAELFNNLICNK